MTEAQTPRPEEAPEPRVMTRSRALTLAVSGLVFVVALARIWPPQLVADEPENWWALVPQMDPLSYLVEPFAGYLAVWTRAAFLVAHPFGDLGPLVTRVLMAGVVAGVAAWLASSRAARAIPSTPVRVAFALSLALLPIKPPYQGPLYVQWWLGFLALAIAFVPPRRSDYPLLAAIGLSGVAPCFALPAFRDRRFLALLAPTLLQAVIYLGEDRSVTVPVVRIDFLIVGGLSVLSLVLPGGRRPLRVAFVALGLGWILAGAIGGSPTPRYLVGAWTAIYLGVLIAIPAIASALTGRFTAGGAYDDAPRTRASAQPRHRG